MQKVCPCVLVGLQFWYPHMHMNIGDLEKTEEGDRNDQKHRMASL